MIIEIPLPDGMNVRLSEMEARKLQADLNRLLGGPATVPIYVEREHLPVYPAPSWPIVTCGPE